MPILAPKKLTIAHARKVQKVVSAGLCAGLGKPEPGKMCVEAAVCYALGLPHSDNPKCVSNAVRAFKIKLNDSGWSSNRARAKGLERVAIAQLGSAGVVNNKEFVTRLAELTIREIVPLALRASASMKGNVNHRDALNAAADRCENEGTKDAAYAAYAAANAANAAYVANVANAAYAAAYVANAANAAAYAANAAAYVANAANVANAAYAAAYVANAANAAAYAAAAAAAADANRDQHLSWSAEICVRVLTELKSPGAKWVEKLCPKKPRKPAPDKVES